MASEEKRYTDDELEALYEMRNACELLSDHTSVLYLINERIKKVESIKEIENKEEIELKPEVQDE